MIKLKLLYSMLLYFYVLCFIYYDNFNMLPLVICVHEVYVVKATIRFRIEKKYEVLRTIFFIPFLDRF